MKEVVRKHYIAEGERARQLIAEGTAKNAEWHNAVSAFAEKYGTTHKWGNQDSVWWIGTAVGKSAPLPSRPGFKVEERWFNGHRYAVLHGDKRTVVGKAFSTDLEELNAKGFSFSDFIVREYGVDRSVIGPAQGSRSGLARFISVAGMHKGALVFTIPFGGDVGDDDVSIPAELVEIPRSKFIELTEE